VTENSALAGKVRNPSGVVRLDCNRPIDIHGRSSNSPNQKKINYRYRDRAMIEVKIS